MVNSAISFFEASNNTVYHNNFENNSVNYTVQVYNSGSCVNVWDNGYPSGGNYWSDYQTKYAIATMLDNSGIGDIAYVIDDQNRDNYPFMEPLVTSAIATPSIGPTVAEPIDNIAANEAVLIGVSAVIMVILVVVGLIVYYKRRCR